MRATRAAAAGRDARGDALPRRIRTLLIGLVLALPALAHATPEDVEKCVRANFPQRSLKQTLRLVSVDRVGAETELVTTLAWKRYDEQRWKMYLRVEAPPDLRGAAFLVVDKEPRSDMFVYLPELRKVRRISGRTVSGSLFGTDFSYEDLERLHSLGASAQIEGLPDVEVAGRPAHVLAVRPAAGEESAYARIVWRIDRQTCVPLEAEFYGADDELQKRLTADAESLVKEGGVWIATRMRMQDLSNETHTRLHLDGVEIDVEIPDREFSESRLARGR